MGEYSKPVEKARCREGDVEGETVPPAIRVRDRSASREQAEGRSPGREITVRAYMGDLPRH